MEEVGVYTVPVHAVAGDPAARIQSLLGTAAWWQRGHEATVNNISVSKTSLVEIVELLSGQTLRRGDRIGE